MVRIELGQFGGIADATLVIESLVACGGGGAITIILDHAFIIKF